MAVDLSLTLGDVITAVAIVGGALIAWGGLRGAVTGQGKEFSSFAERTEAQFDDIKIEVKKIGDVLVQMADFKGEMKLIQERIMLQGKRLDDVNTEMNKVRDEVRRRND